MQGMGLGLQQGCEGWREVDYAKEVWATKMLAVGDVWYLIYI